MFAFQNVLVKRKSGLTLNHRLFFKMLQTSELKNEAMWKLLMNRWWLAPERPGPNPLPACACVSSSVASSHKDIYI